ncbi:uncharacterized protein LOC141701391 [Apium graveolens]|uniref:uncharacterized protein LOC141701391 n=1 Tax=Apium graveolens TaxID=4045 RepID=UPI003D7A09B4
MATHVIGDLRPKRTSNWRIRVRVSSKWCDRNFSTGHRNALNLILVDEEHNRIRAFVGETVLHYFDKKFIESHAYEIRNFVVKYYEPTEAARCFKDDKFILQSNLTKATALHNVHANIPTNVWQFTELAAISEFQENVLHCIDVVGIFYSVEPTEKTTIPGKTNVSRINFCITDSITKVNVTFKGKLAPLLDVALIEATEQPVVLAMTSCKIMFAKQLNEIFMCNTQATRINTNPNTEIAATLRRMNCMEDEQSNNVGDANICWQATPVFCWHVMKK